MRGLCLSLGLAVAMVASGCYGNATPGPTPGSMDDVIAGLVLRGVTVHNLVSGDAGCPSSTLHDNAVRFDLALGAQSATHEIYLLRWKDQTDFDAASTDFANCLSEYRALHPERTVSVLDVSPWRAYGTDGSEQALAVVFDALRAAGGGGSVSSMAP